MFLLTYVLNATSAQCLISHKLLGFEFIVFKCYKINENYSNLIHFIIIKSKLGSLKMDFTDLNNL